MTDQEDEMAFIVLINAPLIDVCISYKNVSLGCDNIYSTYIYQH